MKAETNLEEIETLNNSELLSVIGGLGPTMYHPPVVTSGGDVPKEGLSLNFGKVPTVYTPSSCDSNPGMSTSYDISSHTYEF